MSSIIFFLRFTYDVEADTPAAYGNSSLPMAQRLLSLESRAERPN